MKTKIYQKYVNQFFRDLTSLGSMMFYTLVLGLSLVFQELDLFLKLLLGLILIMAVSVLARIIYFKNRPKKQDYKSLIEKLEAASFPSIHTARIVFLGLELIFFFKKDLVTAFFILLMVLVAYSRVYLKKHDWVDLIGGAGLGIIVFWVACLVSI